MLYDGERSFGPKPIFSATGGSPHSVLQDAVRSSQVQSRDLAIVLTQPIEIDRN